MRAWSHLCGNDLHPQCQATPGACYGLRVVSLSPSPPVSEDEAHSHTLRNLQVRPHRLDIATTQPLPCLTCTCALSLLRCLSAKMSLMLLFALCLRPVKDRLHEFRGTDRLCVQGYRQTMFRGTDRLPGAPRPEKGPVQASDSDRSRLGKEKGQALRGCFQLQQRPGEDSEMVGKGPRAPHSFQS